MGDIGDDTRVVGMTCGPSIVLRKTSVDLSNSVGFSFSLAIVANMMKRSSVGDIGDDTRVVSMTCSPSIVLRKTSVDLSNGVGLSFSVSLAIVTMMKTIVTSVTHSTISSHMTISIVNTSDHATIGETMSHLTQGVGVTGHTGNNGNQLKTIN